MNYFIKKEFIVFCARNQQGVTMHSKFLDLLEQDTIRVLGLMSGTSADGLDICCAEFSGRDPYPEYRIRAKDFIAYPDRFSEAFKRPLELTGAEIAHFHMDWGRWVGSSLQNLREKYDVIAIHGQTLLHQPPDYTLQIGEPYCISEQTNKPVIYDFRKADVCLGGQGAPLIPIVDDYLLRDKEHAVIALNMGGIANITYLPPQSSNADVLAWDTGPANTLIDKAVIDMTGGKELYDDQGNYARRGKAKESTLKKLLGHPYLQRDIPKSAGQEQFGYELYRDLRKQAKIKSREDAYDFVRTLTEFTVRSIAKEIRKRLPSDPPVKKLYASGGGAENTFIMHRLQDLLPGMQIEKFDLPGIDSGIKEAFGFSYLGYLFLRGLPGNVPSVTGASRKAVLGKIVYPG